MNTRSLLFKRLLLIHCLALILCTSLQSQPVTARSLAEADAMSLRLVAPSNVATGATLTYRVEIGNDAPASDLQLVLTLPSGTRFLSAGGDDWRCTTTTTTEITCQRASLPATGATPSTIEINTIAPTSAGAIRASAVLSAGGSERARSEATTTLTATSAQADLQVEVSAPSAVEVGVPFSVQVRLSNHGTGVASHVQLVASLSVYLASHFTAHQPAACSPAGWIITCQVDTLVAGDALTWSLEVEAPIHEAFVPFAVNVSSASAESNLADNTLHIEIPINRPAGEADLRLSSGQARPVNPVVAGTVVQYAIQPGNWGPQSANATLQISAPAGFTILGTASYPGWPCTSGALSTTCNGGIADLADRYRYATTVYALAPTTPGAYAVNSTITGDRSDPLPANNSATVSTIVAASSSPTADLAVTSEVAPAPAAPGSHVTYALHVRNHGPAVANHAVLLVPLFEPDWIYGADQTGWTAPAGWDCTNYYNHGFLCQKERLTPADGEETLTFHLLAPVTAGTYNDRVGVGSDTGDANPANNVATASLTVAAASAPAADLALNGISYEGAPYAVASGATVRVHVKLLNQGPDVAPNAHLLLRLPSGWSFVGIPSPAPWHCTLGVQTLECQRADFAVTPTGSDGEEFVFDAVAPMVSSRAAYQLTAYFNSTATNIFRVWEPYSGVSISVSNQEVNLRITVNDTGYDPSNVGADFRYELHVRNIGTNSAAPIGVIADIPGTIALVRAVSEGHELPTARGPGWLWGYKSNDALAPGAERVITLYLQAPPTTGTLSSRFTAYSGDVELDRSDNVAVEETSFSIGAITADLRLLRTPVTATLCAGAPISYTLAVENQGTERARDLKLVENVPAGLSRVSAVSSDMTCTLEGGLLVCRRPELSVGPGSEVLVSGRAPSTPGIYRGLAGVSGSTADHNTGDNLSEFVLTVTACTAGYRLDWWTVDGGGQTFATGGAYRLGNSAGQADAGTLGSGGLTLHGGFWHPSRSSRALIGPEGGEVSYKGSTGIDLDLRFPDGATAEPLQLIIAEGSDDSISRVGVVGNLFAINAYANDGSDVHHFDKPFVLTVQIDPTLLAGNDLSTLQLAFWDAVTQQWIALPTTPDAATNRLTAQVDHLTTFAVRSPATEQLYLPLVVR